MIVELFNNNILMEVLSILSLISQKCIRPISNKSRSIRNYILLYLRIFILKLFTFNCDNCHNCFFYVYLSINLVNCPNCSQEYCKYCMEIRRETHDNTRCLFRYTLLYVLGLISFLIIYLKFVFVCNSNTLTKYLNVTFFILEHIIYNNKVDNMINNFITVKNITLGLLLLIYYEETDILVFLIVGMIQLMFIIMINVFKEKLKQLRGINYSIKF